ncbi:hypothetical protein BsWGS_21937 [Bradybaena similaris]
MESSERDAANFDTSTTAPNETVKRKSASGKKKSLAAHPHHKHDDGTSKSCRLEADLHRHYDGCTKNPGHKGFIPLDKFDVEYLPLGWQDAGLASCIRSLADITVRVTVKYVSERRLLTVAPSGNLYPGFSYRGQKRITVGTGWVHSVHMFPD